MPGQLYDKPVRQLMHDMVRDHDLRPGQRISRDQVVAWFAEHYPKVKKGTVSAHLLRLSTNAPSRVHYSAKEGEDDLFYQIDSSHFRLYDAQKDSPPITDADSSGAGVIPEVESEDGDEGSGTFAYERDLRSFLSKNLCVLEPGLGLYEDEGVNGIEFPAGGRFIDLLAVDSDQNLVVIELKVSRGYDRAVGQLLRYMGWVEENVAENGQEVRGMVVGRQISEDLCLATRHARNVELFEYELSVSVRKITHGSAPR